MGSHVTRTWSTAPMRSTRYGVNWRVVRRAAASGEHAGRIP